MYTPTSTYVNQILTSPLKNLLDFFLFLDFCFSTHRIFFTIILVSYETVFNENILVFYFAMSSQFNFLIWKFKA